jgi:hypothetical protein
MIEYAKGIKIRGWGNTAYEKDIKKLLDTTITRHVIGQIIFDFIGKASAKDKKAKFVTIVPYKDKDEDGNLKCNAGTDALDPEEGNEAGQPLYQGGDDDPDTKEDDRFTVTSPNKGKGHGSDSDVHFNADQWGSKAKCSQGILASLPDEVLLHEMIHGMRYLQGKRNALPLAGNVRTYANKEEFLSIVIVNIYMSVKGTKQLRGSFDASIALPAKQSTSAGFLTEPDNRKLLTQLKDEELELFNTIKPVKATFNPITELLKK